MISGDELNEIKWDSLTTEDCTWLIEKATNQLSDIVNGLIIDRQSLQKELDSHKGTITKNAKNSMTALQHCSLFTNYS